MGERKGQNKYYPPDFDPKKHKSLNGYHGTHALRERARKLDEGILIIRFEMPYNIWCDGCKAHIAMGVRYNAQKKKVGMYFSTPIHEFRMKCHLCDQHFEIRTDPKNMDYVIMSGAKRKEQRWDMAENEQIVTEDKNDIKRLSVDPMFSLEHELNDKNKIIRLMPTLKELEETKRDWKDDYKLNSMMRDALRSEKKLINEQKSKDKKFLDKWNLDISLVRENEADVKLAQLYKYNSLTSEKSDEVSKLEKRKDLESSSVFNEPKRKSNQQSTSLFSNKPETSKELLKKKLNESYEKKKIISNGFNLNNNVNSDATDRFTNILKSSVVKKSDKNVPDAAMSSKSTTNVDESNLADSKSSSVLSSQSSCLVSNDYGDSSSSEENT